MPSAQEGTVGTALFSATWGQYEAQGWLPGLHCLLDGGGGGGGRGS